MTLPTRRADNRPVAGRWDPFREIEETWTRMARLLGDVASGTGSRSFEPWLSADLPVDVEETDDAFVVEFDLPGVPREDLSIELQDNELHVTGEIKERQRSGVLRRQNRRTGRLEYRILLPGEVNPDAVEAALTDGVLTVRLGKARHSQSRHIDVKS